MTLADTVAQQSNAQIDAEVAALEAQTQRANRRLCWQSALLLPLTLIAILGLTLAVGRPLRQLDRAISELGRGTFSRPIAVSGPLDLERLGGQLEWLRSRLLDLAQERNRFLRHMSHELKTPLANIREGTELLMDGAVGELDSNQREVTGILRDNGIKLQRLIENLLSFSAWQTSSVGLDTSEFRLRPVVKQVLENQQLTLLSQRVRLDVKVEDVTLRRRPRQAAPDPGEPAVECHQILAQGRHDPYQRARAPSDAVWCSTSPTRAGHLRTKSARISSMRSTPAARRRRQRQRHRHRPVGRARIRVRARRHRRDRRRRISRRALPHPHARAPQCRRSAGQKSVDQSQGTCACGVNDSASAPWPLPLLGAALLADGLQPRRTETQRSRKARRPRWSTARRLPPPCSSDMSGPAAKAGAERTSGAGRDSATLRNASTTLAPTPSHQLRYALVLAAPGHAATDLPRAQQLLRDLLATPETLLPSERALALSRAAEGGLSADPRGRKPRLQSNASRDDRREARRSSNKRLQAEIDENARLRKELDEARAKLDAIANIERSLNERKPARKDAHREPAPNLAPLGMLTEQKDSTRDSDRQTQGAHPRRR